MFRDRSDAGVQLSRALESLRSADVIVVALGRGSVPVAYQVARLLGFPLDVIAVERILAPGSSDVVLGSLAEAGVVVLDEYVRRRYDHDGKGGAPDLSAQRKALALEADRMRRERAPISLLGKTAIIVDEGLTDRGTAQLAAIQALRKRGAVKVVLATPVAASAAIPRLREEADDVFALQTPPVLGNLREFYEAWNAVSLEEAADLLSVARRSMF